MVADVEGLFHSAYFSGGVLSSGEENIAAFKSAKLKKLLIEEAKKIVKEHASDGYLRLTDLAPKVEREEGFVEISFPVDIEA